MCGISGIIKKNGDKVTREEIFKMNEVIAHRGPNGDGFYYGQNFAFGHRRLAVIDISDDGKQPMIYMEKYVITYNGEIYNFLNLREELSKAGYSFETETDTEVILAAYDKWSYECVEHFNGMWAFAIFDYERNIIFCSRDRFGVKPFYYCEIDDKFLFASEIKQFTVADGWRAKANRNRVIDFLMFEMFDYTEETLFEGVYQLRGGYNLIYDLKNNQYKIYNYYNLEKNISEKQVDYEEAKDELYEILSDSIKLRLQSDVKIGSCLSGGIDSSTIVCLINNILKNENQNVKQETVSSCFNNKKYDEREYIDEVTRQTNVINYKTFPNFNELFSYLDEITWHQDEPFGSTSIFAQWNVFNLAKEKGITVMLDGQGADEQFAGYGGFLAVYLSELLRNLRLVKFFEESNYIRGLHGFSLFGIAKNAGKFLMPNSIKAFVKYLLKEGLTDWIRVDKKYYKSYLDNLYGSYIKTLKDYSLNQLLSSSLPKLLHYEDRNSMAHSIEARVPFLDYRLVEMVVGLPCDYKISDGVTKNILRDSMSDILPNKIKDRMDKMGFVTPEEVWIRENKELFKNELDNACKLIGDIVDNNGVLKWYDELVNSNSKIDFTIWRLISLGRWIKVFNVEM